MKNVLRVYKYDIIAAFKNKFVLVILIGLMIIPSLYAWFNIGALIDPYANASNLPIGVYSEDKGAKYDNETINVGDEVVSNLKDNEDLSWQFAKSKDELSTKVDNGEYYGAIVIPETFSSELIDAIDTYKSPSINYIVNEKVNAIAPKMTEAGAEAIQLSINSEITGALTEYIVSAGNDIADEVNNNEDEYYKVSDEIDNLVNNFTNIDSSLSTISSYKDQTIEFLNELEADGDLAESKINSIDYSTVYSRLDELKADAEVINQNEAIQEAGLTDQVDMNAIIDDLISDVETVESKTENFNVDIDTSSLQTMGTELDDFKNNKWPVYKQQISNVQTELTNLKLDYQSIEEYLLKDSSSASSFMESPVELETTRLYPVDNYGSASMPFYTTLCLWVGSLLLASLLSFESKLEVSNIEQYFGKLLTFLTISIPAAVIVTLGDMTLLDISIASPKYLLLYDLLIVVVFTTIVYTLVYVFGNIGKALGIVILVLSISGGGGNFPIEVSGEFFQTINPYLPFTYGVKLLREATAGINIETAVECIKVLIGMQLISLVFGVFGSKFIKNYFDKFDAKCRESGLVH